MADLSKLNLHDPIVQKALRIEKARRAQIAGQKLFQKQAKEVSTSDAEFFLQRCHAKQREFLADESARKALLCPRRNGKTTASLFQCLLTDLKFPGSTIAYVVPDSKAHARRLFWRPFQELDQKLQLGLTFKEVEKRIITPRGTDILLFGAKDKNAGVAQMRGDAYSLVMMDECKDFGAHFEELVLEAVMPGLDDYGGTLVLEGTPGNILDGFFYQVTTGQLDGWNLHKWTKADNTFLRPEARDLDLLARNYPGGKESPRYKRECLGQWVGDDDERLYQYDHVRNGWDGHLPEGGHAWMHVMGVDFGERDANAFIVGAFAPTCRYMYIVHQYARSRMSIDEIAEKIRELMIKYPNMVSIVGDTGGYGRGIVTDLQNRHSLPIEAAEKKRDKLGSIAQMNSDFLLGRIHCAVESPLAKEWLRLYKRIRPSDKKILLDHTDLGDAALYMWKASQHWASQEVEPEPLPGTREYWIKQENEAIKKVSKSRAENEWWGTPVSNND